MSAGVTVITVCGMSHRHLGAFKLQSVCSAKAPLKCVHVLSLVVEDAMCSALQLASWFLTSFSK